MWIKLKNIVSVDVGSKRAFLGILNCQSSCWGYTCSVMSLVPLCTENLNLMVFPFGGWLQNNKQICWWLVEGFGSDDMSRPWKTSAHLQTVDLASSDVCNPPCQCALAKWSYFWKMPYHIWRSTWICVVNKWRSSFQWNLGQKFQLGQRRLNVHCPFKIFVKD